MCGVIEVEEVAINGLLSAKYVELCNFNSFCARCIFITDEYGYMEKIIKYYREERVVFELISGNTFEDL